jgi:hypothetical protein
MKKVLDFHRRLDHKTAWTYAVLVQLCNIVLLNKTFSITGFFASAGGWLLVSIIILLIKDRIKKSKD